MKDEYILIYDIRADSDFRLYTKIEFCDKFKDALRKLRNLKRESEKAPEFIKNIQGIFQKVA